ncbi:PAS domain-containing sensor histidine kinase [Paraburkholderia strydomiana]|uniref:PAS domain-containing sensor histidine kinase n=1 Tax=Paraburkholderia strydomiana TaxID=1245417 RepID=UPI00286A23AA|nr:PAS domain S-box protein [Paraburkholderia strydomiana]
MSNVERIPDTIQTMTELQALLAATPGALDAIPGAVYLCDREGWLLRCNSQAAELWGRTPTMGEERFCGSHQLFLPDGTPVPHEQCPMADAIFHGTVTQNAEVVMERPDGSRIVALVNIRPLRDAHGNIEGAINCFQDITARRHLEDEFRRNTEDLEDFFENGAVALHIVDREGIIVRANRAELDLLGYTKGEYVGRHIAEFHADECVITEILQRLAMNEPLVRFPARLRAKDGSIRHVLVTSNGRFVDGKLLNTRCFTTDVTMLHQAETARRESEERLAATYEAATVAIAETDADGRLLRVNNAQCRILGRSRDELLSMRFTDYTHEEDQQKDAAMYARQVSGDLAHYSIRKRARRSDGTIAYLDVFSSSVRDAQGRFRYGVRVIQDVTATQRLEDRLREREQHMRELLEALPAAVYTTDAHGRITFYNKAAVQMAGRTPVAGDHWCVTWRLFWPDGRPLPHDQCPMAVALREDRPVRGLEAVAERPDGTRVPFLPHPTPLHDADGRLVGAINMLVDITELKQAENRQKTLIDELNHRVKNTLATVQSLATQTARHARNVDEFVGAFESRLLSLGRAHELLATRHWQDAPLEALVREITTPLTGAMQERTVIAGPPITVAPRIALNLTMCINELLTNAAKYGSLGAAEGSLAIRWDVRPEERGSTLDLCWLERGGPPVKPPEHRGFGTRLIERCIERDLGGLVELSFHEEGLHCRLTIPLTIN